MSLNEYPVDERELTMRRTVVRLRPRRQRRYDHRRAGADLLEAELQTAHSHLGVLGTGGMRFW